MEVMIPSPSAARAFNFDSASTTPYLSATSSPQRSTASFFYSAPTSPTRISTFYRGGDHHLSTPSAVPFLWEEKPGTPKSPSHLSTAASSTYGDADQDLDDADFAFDFSGHLERHSLPADELFHAGQIKPLKPPPRLHYSAAEDSPPPLRPKSPREKIARAFSPRHRAKPAADPFAAATDRIRGRERTTTTTSNHPQSRERNKGSSRSLSPLRVSDLLFDSDLIPEDEESTKTPNSNSNSNSNTSSFASFWYKKWKIKDLLLFRSASESRAKDKEQQLKKYSQLKKTTAATNRNDDVRNSSFRSTDSVGSVSSRRRSGPPISAHELHYTMNRAFSEEMRRRTSLPYKQGLLGCLGFNPTAPEIPKGVVSSTGSLPRDRF